MSLKSRFLVAAMLPLFLGAGYAQEQENKCPKRENLIVTLQTKYKENRRFLAITNEGVGMIEFFASPSGSWTEVATKAGAMESCIVASGEGWVERGINPTAKEENHPLFGTRNQGVAMLLMRYGEKRVALALAVDRKAKKYAATEIFVSESGTWTQFAMSPWGVGNEFVANISRDPNVSLSTIYPVLAGTDWMEAPLARIVPGTDM